ncbi:hypothetical protein TNCV_344631 [Trichonephila clavipes]|nr:hypothetical protein TNCV_344631 [Trichonephila clavipes]
MSLDSNKVLMACEDVSRNFQDRIGMGCYLTVILHTAQQPKHSDMSVRFYIPFSFTLPFTDICDRGSLMVWVSDRGLPCHEFEPSTTKDPPCRAAMHVKSVES